MKIAYLFIALFAASSLSAQDVQESDLTKLVGNYEGSLTYTDYGDDESKVNLKADLTITEKKGKLTFKYIYYEPNGDEVKRKGSMSRGKSADQFEFGSSWKILDFKRTGEGWEMKLFALGKDNNKNSEIQMDISFTGSNLVYVKEVKYNDGVKFFERNRHEFTKK